MSDYQSEQIRLTEIAVLAADSSDEAITLAKGRWPPAPLAVGDVIESDCEEDCPTDGVGIVDALGTVAQIFDGDIMWANGGEDEWGTLLQRHLPLTVIYVPELV